MRSITILLGLIECSWFTVAAVAQSVPNLNDGLVYVRVIGPDGKPKEYGTGFVVGPYGHLLTSKHLFESFDEVNDSIQVSFKRKDASPVVARKFGCSSANGDLCLLYVNRSAVKDANISQYFKLICRMPIQSEPILAAGFPKGQFSPSIVVPGNVTSDGYGEQFKIYMKAGIVSGMSGGPIFANGYVIGTVFGADGGLETFSPLIQDPELIAKTGEPCASDDHGSVLTSFPTAGSLGVGTTSPQSTLSVSGKTVFVQISNESQRAAAVKLIKSLKDIGIDANDGIENVKGKSPPNAQIRYYNDEDLAAAQSIKDVAKANGIQAHLVKLSLKAPRGLIEFWFQKTS